MIYNTSYINAYSIQKFKSQSKHKLTSSLFKCNE